MRCSFALIAAGLTVISLSSAAPAQEDLEKGKSGAQIFATDCAICHKTPQAAVKGGAPGEGFLRQHYTSSQQSAAAVAAYLRTIRAPASAERGSKSKGTPKAAAKPKGNRNAKPAEQKPSVEARPSETQGAREERVAGGEEAVPETHSFKSAPGPRTRSKQQLLAGLVLAVQLIRQFTPRFAMLGKRARSSAFGGCCARLRHSVA
jgi:hypothetical protein